MLARVAMLEKVEAGEHDRADDYNADDDLNGFAHESAPICCSPPFCKGTRGTLRLDVKTTVIRADCWRQNQKTKFECTKSRDTIFFGSNSHAVSTVMPGDFTMSLPPIGHTLSNFEQIEILRHEIEQFEEEFKKTESRIRDVMYQIEKQRFLMTVHQVFQHGPMIAEAAALPEMENTRETLASALGAMREILAELEAVSGPIPPRPPQRPMQSSLHARPPSLQMPPVPQPGNLAGNSTGNSPGNPGMRKNRFDAF